MPAHALSLPKSPTIVVEHATTLAAIREAQALRHQVFCLERKFLPEDREQGLDQDGFDVQARHVIVRRQAGGEVIATTRVVAAQNSAEYCLPMQHYCGRSLFRGWPMAAMGEISRFAISKLARQDGSLSGPHVRLALLQGVLQASETLGLTHWCALMEPSLIRLLAATGVQFVPVGPMVECSGQRQPCIARIDRTIAIGLRSHPHFHKRVVGREFLRAA